MRKIVFLLLALVVSFTSFSQKKIKKKKVKKPVLVSTASGLKYSIVQKGNGAQPQAGDLVNVHYVGRLTNDTIFDSSVERGQPFAFKLGVGQVIKGWDEIVALLHVGDKANVTIPPDLAYGSNPVGTIPANSTLLFEVELLDMIPAPKPAAVTKSMDTITTASGLKYIMLKKNPNGVLPQKGDKLTVHYSGFLTDGQLFDSSVERAKPFEFKIGASRVIKGWEEGFTYLRQGERAKFIIPHALAYGEKGMGIIPAKSDLIFDVELLLVTPRKAPKPYDIAGLEVKTTESGLKYIRVKENPNGPLVVPGNVVMAHYTGFLEDSTMFDSTVDLGKPFQFVIGKNQVIKGWEEAFLLMRIGEKYRIIIPPALAYGEKGKAPAIKPNSTLIFDVEIMSAFDPVKPKSDDHGGHDHSDPNHKH
ncbi:MAG: FKBP-type peptidyl-prolyl cis-trans isomerase [Bacteroidetes bacterium]|nr:FKBP-type peptidyl-prolyl cis-trans isomerase [Bacteroidota bacterium]